MRVVSRQKNGFTLAELLIVVAIVAILVAICIPVFSSYLEKSKEATDLSNVRSAYSEVMAAAAAGDTSSSLYDSSAKTYSKTVKLEQQQDGWSTSTPITIGGISSDSSNWVGSPVAGRSCTVSYKDGQVTIEWEQDPTCVLSGSSVMLADGSTKLIDDITTDDQLKTFNFFTGATDGNYPMYVLKHVDVNCLVITLTLDNGTILEISDSQQFFDVDMREYFEISSANYQEAVGANILTVDNDVVGTAQIIEATIEQKVCTSYEVFTEYNKNFVTNGVLTLEPDTWRQGVYAISEDFTIDMDQYQVDVAEYGQYSYDEFADIMTEDQFEKMNVADTKIAVGKGILQEAEMFDLYREWMLVYDAALSSE